MLSASEIAEREEKLFADWAEDKTYFVRDGALGEYSDHYPKVAFVLKEYAHPKPKEQNFDLRAEEFGNAQYQIWVKIGKVMHAIRQMHLSPERREEYCRDVHTMHPSACVLNLDKEGGHPDTDMMMLALRAMKDACFIRKQFEIYDPDVTICAGTYEIFKYILGDEKREWKTQPGGAWQYERAPGKFVLGTYHPSYPSETAENFIAAVTALDLNIAKTS